MIRNYILTWLISLLTVTLYAGEVSSSTATHAAQNVYRQLHPEVSPASVHTIAFESICRGCIQNNPEFYVFDAEGNTGLVFISKNNSSYPLLGYTDNDDVDKNYPALPFVDMLRQYNDELKDITVRNLEETPEILANWEMILDGNSNFLNSNHISRNGTPLLATNWRQGAHYNDNCPWDNQHNGRSIVGCVATAMAQVMKFWNFPTQGSGTHSYTYSTVGTVSANFGSTTYNWANMPNVVNTVNNDVATLSFHCGVAVDMQYSSSSSGAYTLNANSPTPYTAENALKQFFKYDPNTVRGIVRDNYSQSNWINAIRAEIMQNRPIIYSGHGTGGHAFVCDDENNGLCHMNWGWGGSYNGYFNLSALNPGTYNFSSNQRAIIGIQPTNFSLNTGLTANGFFAMYNGGIQAGNNFQNGTAYTLKAYLVNYCDTVFKGKIAAMLLNDNYQITDTIGVYTETSGKAINGTYNPVSISIPAMHNIAPGEHFIELFVRNNQPGADWQPVSNGYFSNIDYAYFTPDPSTVNSNLSINCGPNSMQPFPPVSMAIDTFVTLCIDNVSTFNGNLRVDIFDINGNFLQNFATLNSVTIPAGTYSPPIFTNQLNLAPGKYLIGIRSQQGANAPLFISSSTSNWSNPETYTVVGLPLHADLYEPNDSEIIATPLTFPLVNDTASQFISTSIYEDYDRDFWEVQLPSLDTFDISVSIRGYNSDSLEGQTNVIWDYRAENDTAYSFAFYADSTRIIRVGGISKFYIDVDPLFLGLVGDYSLKVGLEKVVGTGINDNDKQPEIKVQLYPNPATTELTLLFSETIVKPRFKIYDITGNTLQMEGTLKSNKAVIDISSLSPGVYAISMQNNLMVPVKKLFVKL